MRSIFVLIMSLLSAAASTADDPFLWLEEVQGERALGWVRERNAISTNELASRPEYDSIRKRLLSILDSKDKIPFVTKHGEHLYNFWRDDKNVRGLWRRTTLDEYRKKEPKWDVVIDLDALAKEENENWVWKGFYSMLYPDYDRALVHLSRGGTDATVVRELDLVSKRFVQDGFYVPEAKTRVTWRDRNTVYIGTDFGPGSLTSSGYPRLAKEWKRGTPLSEAKIIYEGQTNDVSVDATVRHYADKRYDLMQRGITFYTDETLIRRGDDWVKLDKPLDAEVTAVRDHLLFRLRTDWETGGKKYAGGALLAKDVEAFLRGDREMQVLFEPGERRALQSFSETKNFLILDVLDELQNQVEVLEFVKGKWKRSSLDVPRFGSVSVEAFDRHQDDQYWITLNDFLNPSRLYLGRIGKSSREELKSLPSFFNAAGLKIEQFHARSKDGTKVPYFVVGPKKITGNGKNPTLLYGYGGFEIPMLPSYQASMGAAWLERGGVYVLANIRGGGEFGPKWHEAARKANRQRGYDDFIAVAEDLIARKVTSPPHLGIQGGSNGGLLMGAMFTQRPDLFGAVVCQVPLLDMRRYHLLLAGASWIAEYGNPDVPEEWAYISKYSPYQNVSKDKKYPPILFTTSTRDDRVHPGHARKMAAKMMEQGHRVLYYENIEGGHGGAANNEQIARMAALSYTFLIGELTKLKSSAGE